MSTETTSKLPAHQVSKRSRAPPPPTKKLSADESKNGSLSEQTDDTLKNNGSLDDIGSSVPGQDERQITVVLPNEKAIKASVFKDTPILELLIMIASKNKLNPTGHMLAQPAPRPKDPPIQLKPTQKLSDVVGDTVYIIPRNQKQLFVYKKDFKKSAVYEPTTRITVISSKNHKMCLRVDPEKTLEQLMPLICDERGVEMGSHALRLVGHPQDPLDMSQTLEKTGVVEFLLVDLRGPPSGGESDFFMPEQKKKKGSFFGRMTKKKKGYEFGGGGGIPEAPPTSAMTSSLDRSRRHTLPASAMAGDHTAPQAAPVAQEQEDGNSTLKKRRPAPPPPPGKNLTGASDEEKLEDSSSTLRKRRAPAPPRPMSPPTRSQSLGARPSSPPARPASPPVRTSAALTDGEAFITSPKQEGSPRLHTDSISSSLTETGIEEAFQEVIAEAEAEIREKEDVLANYESPHQELSSLAIEGAVEMEGVEAEHDVFELGEVQTDGEVYAFSVATGEAEKQDKDSKAQKELLSHMMKMSLDEDTKDTTNYPPHTQADDPHDNMLEEKSVHALAFEVTRESAVESQESPPGGPDVEEEEEEEVEVEVEKESPRTEEDELKGSPVVDHGGSKVEKESEEIKMEGSPQKAEEEKKGSPGASPQGGTVENVNEQYAALQAQLAALQKQMLTPQQPGMIEMQMQQLQQQMLLQQQIINQMMMSTSQQPMVLPLAFQQAMLSPQQQMLLAQQQQMVSPPQQMLSPQQQMISPQQQMMSPQQQMLSQQMLSPQQQMVVPPQQLMMTPPMMYSPGSIPQGAGQPNVYPQQIPATATVQAQQTPISSTHELSDSLESPTKDVDSPTKETGSPMEESDSPVKDTEMPMEDTDVITSEVDASVVHSEPVPRPLSPALKADEVSVGHPTYHFARSHEVSSKEAKVSPPNTLRSPKQQPRPALLQHEVKTEDEGQESVKKDVPEPQTETTPQVDADKNPTEADSHTEKAVDTNQNQTSDADRTEQILDKNRNGTVGETSSISAFAVPETDPSEPVPSGAQKSPKQKKSGFSLFKKKTPKYSYILSAQKEFSRKSETERQRSSDSPPKPADLKSDSGKGSRDLWPR